VVKTSTKNRNFTGPQPIAGGIRGPNGIALSHDQKTLYVSEYQGTHVWAFRIADDGSASAGERLMLLRAPDGRADTGGDGMTTDAEGRVWVTSHLGIQVFEADGRPLGIIPRPQDKGTVSCTFGGAEGAYLYVASSDKVYRRKTKAHRADVP
jgi:gluconolactonase